MHDVVVHRLRIRHYIQNLLRIKTARRSRRDVAQIIRTGTTSRQAEIHQFGQHIHRIARHDLADLNIVARRAVRIAPTPILGDLSQTH